MTDREPPRPGPSERAPGAPRAVVFSDLDGTLLDAETYSWEAAVPGLEALRRHGVQLVACTSKTAAELCELARRMGLEPPGVVENGAGVAWRFEPGVPAQALSAAYAAVRAALHEIRSALGLPLVGFGDAGPAEVARRTGLSPEDAVLALERAGDEPFWAERPLHAEEIASLEEAAAERRLVLTSGGRFFHLHGRTDKGEAARRVLAALGGNPLTAAFGDAANDVPLLAAAHVRFAVRRPGGDVDPMLAAVRGVRLPRAPGPAGFAEGAAALVAEWAGALRRPGG